MRKYTLSVSNMLGSFSTQLIKAKLSVFNTFALASYPLLLLIYTVNKKTKTKTNEMLLTAPVLKTSPLY